MQQRLHCMANSNAIVATSLWIVFFVSLFPAPANSFLTFNDAFPEVEITLANDGSQPIMYMCQLTNTSNGLHILPANQTYRFNFRHVAFPMRWCYLYINERSNGFFWAYTVRTRCSKCFWSITEHPGLYRGEKGRWERQKLFMPPKFKSLDFVRESDEADTTLQVPYQTPPAN